MPQDKRLSYRDFTQKEIDSLVYHGVLNGIGPQNPKWFTWCLRKFMNVCLHSWLTQASGNVHDLSYQFGGTERHRYNDDLGFYLMILNDAVANSKNSFIWLIRAYIAKCFMLAVRFGGSKRFHYGNYRTKQEVMNLRYK